MLHKTFRTHLNGFCSVNESNIIGYGFRCWSPKVGYKACSVVLCALCVLCLYSVVNCVLRPLATPAVREGYSMFVFGAELCVLCESGGLRFVRIS